MQSKHIVIIVAIIAIASVASILILTNNNASENDGDNSSDALNGTYIYETHGKYNSGTKGYTGYWTLSYDDGKCVINTKNVQAVSSSLVSDGIGISMVQPIGTHPLGYVDPIPDKNSLLKNASYAGKDDVDTTNYGSMELNVYESGLTQYYCDDNGMIYRIISTISVNGSSLEAVFELT